MIARRTTSSQKGLWMFGHGKRAAVTSLLVAASATSYAAGCTGDTGDTATPPWTPGGTVAPKASATPRRTIEDRNPFGNTDAAANLMADGDFELTGRQDQMPWVVFDGNGQATLNFDTGGRCRSGVRCGAVAPSEQVIGWMSTPRSGSMRVSLWARPSSGVCKDFSARILDIDEGTGGTPLYATEERADAKGWCHFLGVVPSLAGKAPVLYGSVESKAGVVLLDDVVAEPTTTLADGGVVGLTTRASRPFTAEEAARFHATVTWLRDHRRYGRPPSRTIDDPMPRYPLDR